MLRYRSVALAAVVVLAACGSGGGGTASPVIPGGGGGPTASPAPGPTGGTASITISIPFAAQSGSESKAPAYVSPGTTTLRVQVNTVNGSAPPAWVPADVSTALVVGTNCTIAGGTETCTVPVAAPPGSVSYTFTAGDGTHPLSTATTVKTIVTGTANSFTVTLQGIVATVTVSGTALAANAAPSGGAETLTVTAFDADANQIVAPGNYNNPITLTDNDATAVTTLSNNGGAAASSVVVNSPADVVTLKYNGQAVNAFTVGASGTGITGGGTIAATVNDITFTGTTLDNAANGGLNTDPNWGQQTMFFAQASGNQNFTGAELGFTNAPYGKQFDVTLSGGCAGIATISAGPATTFTVTAAGSPGICSGRITERGTGYPITGHTANTAGNPTHNGTFWISVTTSSFGVNHSRN